MSEILLAIGLMLVIEGAMYALFPDGMRQMILRVLALPTQQIRMAGLFCALMGFTIVAVLKGF